MAHDSIGPLAGQSSEVEARRQLEGEARVAQLPAAEFIAITVGVEPGDPVVVIIGWSPGMAERAYPGTAIWQAAIRRFLRSAHSGDPAESAVRAAAAESLERFPSLDRWLSWFDHERQRDASPRARARSRPWWIG